MKDSRTTLGEQLKSARQAAGLSAEAVGNRLRLDPKYVEALETCSYKELPAPAYTRGYIRAYAQLVNCNADELIAEYNAKAGEDPELTDVMSVGHEHSSNDPHILWITVGIIGVLLILLSVWGYDYLRTHELLKPETAVEEPAFPDRDFDADATSPYSVEPRESGEAVSPPVIDNSTVPLSSESDAVVAEPEPGINETDTMPETDPSAPQTGLSEPNASFETEVEPAETGSANDPVTPANARDIQEEVTPVAPSGNDTLSVALSGESWVEVYDSNGYRLAYGLFSIRHSPLSLVGQAPFRVILGNAPMANIKINGATFAITPYIRANSSAAVRIRAPRDNNTVNTVN